MRGTVRGSGTRVFSMSLAMSLLTLDCTSASGDVSGGEPRFEAGTPAPLQVTQTEPTYSDAPDTSWRGIYRDFFGRRATATCAGNGTCHDAVGKPGYVRSNFVCADLEGCYTSLRSAINPTPAISTHAPVEDADIANPDGAFLFAVVRHTLPDGTLDPALNMPQLPADYAYSAAEIDRMKAWIKAGAKND